MALKKGHNPPTGALKRPRSHDGTVGYGSGPQFLASSWRQVLGLGLWSNVSYCYSWHYYWYLGGIRVDKVHQIYTKYLEQIRSTANSNLLPKCSKYKMNPILQTRHQC